MRKSLSAAATGLLSRAAQATGWTQQEMATLCGTSLRTAQRWAAGRSLPSLAEFRTLAAAVYPKDAALAAEMAQEAETTLEAWGIAPPPVPLTRLLPPGPPPRPFPPVALMVDSVLHAATLAALAHAADPVSHDAIAAITRAAFSRARGLGLNVEEVDDALASTTSSSSSASSSKRG